MTTVLVSSSIHILSLLLQVFHTIMGKEIMPGLEESLILVPQHITQIIEVQLLNMFLLVS